MRIKIWILGCLNYDYNPMDGMAKGLYGTHNEDLKVNALYDCQQKCDRKTDCGSVAYCPKIHGTESNCFLYQNILSGTEQIDSSVTNGCTSYYKHCTSTGT